MDLVVPDQASKRILFSASETVYPLPSDRNGLRIPGSWSWMIVTVPADAPSDSAVADGPTTRLATSRDHARQEQ